jgi:hypothetical protein
MAITLNLPPDVEASLTAQARALGLPVNAYVQTLLREAAMSRSGQSISLEQFEAELDELARSSDYLPYLPPQALARESLYEDHD